LTADGYRPQEGMQMGKKVEVHSSELLDLLSGIPLGLTGKFESTTGQVPICIIQDNHDLTGRGWIPNEGDILRAAYQILQEENVRLQEETLQLHSELRALRWILLGYGWPYPPEEWTDFGDYTELSPN